MKTLLTLLILFSCTPEQEIYQFTPVENNHKEFTASVVNKLNKYRTTPIKESENQLVFYLAYKHSERGILDHTGHEERATIIIEHTSYSYVGEILAAGYNDPDSLVTAWINSDSHSRLLLRNYKKITIAKHRQMITALLLK